MQVQQTLLFLVMKVNVIILLQKPDGGLGESEEGFVAEAEEEDEEEEQPKSKRGHHEVSNSVRAAAPGGEIFSSQHYRCL